MSAPAATTAAEAASVRITAAERTTPRRLLIPTDYRSMKAAKQVFTAESISNDFEKRAELFRSFVLY